MASKNQTYIDQYAQWACEQMRRYGIPASVTLAQGILESANGQSRLAQEGNNHFGIKATKEWLDAGGKYGLYTDDKPNEKFCHYDSVGDSYEHHSRFLKNNSRYDDCFKLAADDYKGWCMGLNKAGYATSPSYGSDLIKTIERLGLQKYDQMVMLQLKVEGKAIETEENPRKTAAASSTEADSLYSMPVKRNEFMLITSPFGMRMHPLDHMRKMHNGIDISTRHDDLLATENNGRVIKTGFDSKGGGNYVKVQYDRGDGSKTIATDCHLSQIDVKEGDAVNAGQKLGVSGSTGKSTGDHLHFAIDQIASDGSSRKGDPASYLAEIAQKGSIQTMALFNGKDLLAKYKAENPLSPEQSSLAQGSSSAIVGGEIGLGENISPDAWMKKLLSSEDSGVSLANGDPVMEMLMTAFTGLFAIAVQIDDKSNGEVMQMATDAAVNRQIDLSSLVSGMKSCTLSIGGSGQPVLHLNNGKNQMDHSLSATELNRLSSIINNDSYDVDTKQRLVSSVISGISISQQASLNYEQIASQQQSQQQTIQR